MACSQGMEHGERKGGAASGWYGATGKLAGGAQRWHGKRMACGEVKNRMAAVTAGTHAPARRADGRRGERMSRRDQKVGEVSTPRARRADGTWRHGEHAGGAVSGWHAATGNLEGSAHRRQGERMARGDRKAGGEGTPRARRADSTHRPHSQRGEHTGGTESGWHAAMGDTAGRAYRRRGERMARCDRKAGVEGTPPAQRADVTRRPESWRGGHAAGVESGWHAATGDTAGRAHRRRSERMARGDRKAGGDGTPRARRADSTHRPDSQRSEHTGGTESGWHAATGKLSGSAHHRRGGQIAHGARKGSEASRPPARRADGTRRPRSWRGEHTGGTVSAWSGATRQLAGSAHGTRRAEGPHDEEMTGETAGRHTPARRADERMSRRDRNVGGAFTSRARRADGTHRPDSQQGEHTGGAPSGWHPATGETAG
jgi:hypothetical protein